MMNYLTEEQIDIEFALHRLRNTPGLEQDFLSHETVNWSVCRIFRFLCEDQEWLDRVPAADGSNLDVVEWEETYDWLKLWLSVCHRQRVFWAELEHVHKVAAELVRDEKQMHELNIIEAETKQARVMQPFRRLYEQQGAVLVGRQRRDPVPLMDPDCEILGDLILAESTFEDDLRGTHVEDVLLEKRFDLDLLNDGMRRDQRFRFRKIHDYERDGWWIRQLRQHGFRRPWKQLYQVLDDDNQGDAQTIAGVADIFRDPRIQRALDVQSITLSAMREKSCAAMCGRHDDDEKGTSADFGDHNIVMLQFCGQHWIHSTCAFQAWDALGQDNFSFPCPMCRRDPGRLSTKLELDVREGNYNVGFDPDKEQEAAFQIMQQYLLDDYTLLERQHEFPAAARHKALREQRRLLAYAAEQDRYYDTVLATWDTNPQNRNKRRPVPPRNRELHDAEYFRLYDFDRDDDPPLYQEAHWHELALDLIADGTPARELPQHLLTAWRQYMDRGGFEELVGDADDLLRALGEQGYMDRVAAEEAAYAAANNGNDEDEDEDEEEEEEEEEEEGADEEDGGAQVEDQNQDQDQEMPDADDDDDWGIGAIQNAFARWRKVDTAKGKVRRPRGGKGRAAEAGALRAVRRSPRTRRMVAVVV